MALLFFNCEMSSGYTLRWTKHTFMAKQPVYVIDGVYFNLFIIFYFTTQLCCNKETEKNCCWCPTNNNNN